MRGPGERVARAICKSRGDNPDRRLKDYRQTSFSYWAWQMYETEAKAAIKEYEEYLKEKHGGE